MTAGVVTERHLSLGHGRAISVRSGASWRSADACRRRREPLLRRAAHDQVSAADAIPAKLRCVPPGRYGDMEAVNLDLMLARFTEHWSPKTIAQVNDYDVRIVKVQRAFTWHRPADTDEFLVLGGQLTIQLRDRDVVLGPGSFCRVTRGLALPARRHRNRGGAVRAGQRRQHRRRWRRTDRRY